MTPYASDSSEDTLSAWLYYILCTLRDYGFAPKLLDTQYKYSKGMYKTVFFKKVLDVVYFSQQYNFYHLDLEYLLK